MQEKVHGDQVGDMVDEIDAEESMHEEEGDEGEDDQDEFSMDHDDDGEPAGEFPAGHDEGNAEEQEIEHQVMSIDSKLDELLAKFDEIMGGGEHDMEPPMDGGMEEPGMDNDMSAEPDMDEMFMEDEDEDKDDEDDDKEEDKKKMKTEAKETSGDKKEDKKMKKAEKPEDGKSNMKNKSDAKDPKAKDGKPFESRKSVSDLMREYVEKIDDINLQPSTYSEGEPVGAGTGTKKVAVNNKSISLDKGPDFGGTSENILNGKGNNETPDGKSIPAPKSPYDTSAPQEHPIAKKNVNVPGGGKIWSDKQPAYKDGGDGQRTETGKKVGSTSEKVAVNKKSELSNPGQPNGQKK
jgi:hypothetical protein